MDHGSMSGMNSQNATSNNSMSGMETSSMNMGAMGMSLNAQTNGFAILVDTWKINNTGQFIGALVVLFCLSFFTDLLGRYKFNTKFQNRYVNAFKSTIRAFIGSLLMLCMMTFNVYVILFIVLGTGVAHFVVPSKNDEPDAYLCHS